jgi:hypothetical protein
MVERCLDGRTSDDGSGRFSRFSCSLPPIRVQGSKLSGYLLEMWCENVQKKFVEGELALDMNGGTPTSSMEVRRVIAKFLGSDILNGWIVHNRSI